MNYNYLDYKDNSFVIKKQGWNNGWRISWYKNQFNMYNIDNLNTEQEAKYFVNEFLMCPVFAEDFLI